VEAPGLLTTLRRHPIWVLVGVVVAGLAAASHFYAFPSLKHKDLARSSASTEVVLGVNSALIHTVPDPYDGNLAPRADDLADMIGSPELRAYIAGAAQVPFAEIAVDAPVWSNLLRIQQWNTGQKRASQIVGEDALYRITLENDAHSPPYAPVIDVSTQAPTTAGAVRLARAVGEGLGAYVSDIQKQSHTPRSAEYDVRQILPVAAVPASKSQLANVAFFTFVAVFMLWCALIFAVSAFFRDLRWARIRSKVQGTFDRSSHSRPRWPAPSDVQR
jgi:hypothetical protein